MQRMHAMHPDMTRAGVRGDARADQMAVGERSRVAAAPDGALIRQVRAAYDTGPGYGHCSIASNGMWCASWPEREMCEWLIEQGIEFEMHKALASGRMCDFYFDGVYWEMDGMDRVPSISQRSTVICRTSSSRRRTSVPASSDISRRRTQRTAIRRRDRASRHEMTYDVEMGADGPLNFLANGIVSHNSHAACYALIAYRTAWLKANYPAEYMAALISSVMSTKDKVPFFAPRPRRWASRSCRPTSTSPTTTSSSSRATSASV